MNRAERSRLWGLAHVDEVIAARAKYPGKPDVWIHRTLEALENPPIKAETDDNEHCKHCGVAVYRTQTARGTEWAHVGTKVLFCTSKENRS